MQNKVLISGIFVVEKKWGLIWLKNKVENKSENLNYFKFETLLHRSFDESTIKKILEAINCEKKLLIDFDNSFVKVIKEPEVKFEDCFSKYFNTQCVEEWLENGEHIESDLYNL